MDTKKSDDNTNGNNLFLGEGKRILELAQGTSLPEKIKDVTGTLKKMTGQTQDKVNTIFAVDEEINKSLRNGDRFIEKTENIVSGVLDILKKDFYLDEQEFVKHDQERRTAVDRARHTHSYESYRNFRNSVLSMLKGYGYDAISPDILLNALTDTASSQAEGGGDKEAAAASLYHWISKSEKAKSALKNMFHANDDHEYHIAFEGFSDAVTNQRTVKEYKTLGYEVATVVCEVVKTLRKAKGRSGSLQDQIDDFQWNVPSKKDSLSIFNNYKDLKSIQKDGRSIRVRFSQGRFDVCFDDIKSIGTDNETKVIKNIAELFNKGARIVFVEYKDTQ